MKSHIVKIVVALVVVAGVGLSGVLAQQAPVKGGAEKFPNRFEMPASCF